MSQAATWEPQTTRRRPQRTHLRGRWSPPLKQNKRRWVRRTRKIIYRALARWGFQSFMAVLHKADFIYENMTQWHRLFRVFLREVRSNFLLWSPSSSSTTINHSTCSSKAPPRITLEEAHLAFMSGTSSTQFLIIPLKLFYDLWIRHQVVHNRGHGFSKRFIPAGVYNVKDARFPRDLPASYPCVPSGPLPSS